MIEVNKGDIVVFDAAVFGAHQPDRAEGTAMDKPVNGLVPVAVHERFCVAMPRNLNILTIAAVRVGAIIAVKAGAVPRTDHVLGEVMTDWQGAKR